MHEDEVEVSGEEGDALYVYHQTYGETLLNLTVSDNCEMSTDHGDTFTPPEELAASMAKMETLVEQMERASLMDRDRIRDQLKDLRVVWQTQLHEYMQSVHQALAEKYGKPKGKRSHLQ